MLHIQKEKGRIQLINMQPLLASVFAWLIDQFYSKFKMKCKQLTCNHSDADLCQFPSNDSTTPISWLKLGIGKFPELLRSLRVTKTDVYELMPKKSAVPRILSISSGVNVGKRERGNPCSLLFSSIRSIITCG